MTLNNFQKFLIFVAIAVCALLWVQHVRAAVQDDKVTICHKNNGNGWMELLVDTNSVDGIGNGDHNRSVHQGGQDIIPPGIWDVTGRNWTASGQAIWENHCNEPQPTVVPTSTPEPTIEPSVTPTPTVEQEPTPTVTPTEEVTPTPTDEVRPTPTETPTTAHNDDVLVNNTTRTPTCENGDTVKLVGNPHVWRNGSEATVNFFITEGDSANIYYKEVDSATWTHSVSRKDVKPFVNADNYVSYTIGGLNPNLGYTFGIEQTNGCGGGTVVAVVVDGPTPTLFGFSFWEWIR